MVHYIHPGLVAVVKVTMNEISGHYFACLSTFCLLDSVSEFLLL
jgi:hypothetical protein